MIPPCLKKARVILLFIIANIGKAEETKDTVLVIPDAGRRMRLGELYDARIETPIPGRLFDTIIYKRLNYESPASSTEIDFNADSSLSSRLDFLDVNVEAKFKYARAGITLKIDGSFAYLSDKKKSTKSVKYAARYSHRTKRESLDVFNDNMMSKINQRVFDDDAKFATHFVSSITWGADAFISFENFYTNEDEKENIEVALSGMLNMKARGIKASVDGTLNITEANDEVYEKTDITLYGDLRMDREIPHTPQEAMKFISDLPNLTDTLLEDNGIGVPMEITLTPLTWIDSKAAKLARRIESDTLERLLKIYDTLEESETRILDALALPYDGFTVWNSNMDDYYKEFKDYQVKLSIQINNATTAFLSDEYPDINVFESIETAYYNSNNIFNLMSVLEEIEEREDELKNLLAIQSQFDDAGIIFAEHLKDFYAPTFDSSFDHVYGLVLVGLDPHLRRNSMSLIRDFVDLAAAHKLDKTSANVNIDPKISHCQIKVIGDKEECVHKEAFVAIHFDSYCGDICDPDFCMDKDPPHVGKCGIDLSAAITNTDNPLGDCWCNDPTTQILQFVENGNPVRLDKDLPRVPKQPVIDKVEDEGEDKMEPFGKNQDIELHIGNIDESTRNWKVTVEFTEANEQGDGNVDFLINQRVIYTRSNLGRVVIRSLWAGQLYDIYVAGNNAVGLGRKSVVKKVQVGHRMVDITLTVGGGDPIVNTLTIPSWLESIKLDLTMSVTTTSEIMTVTLHESISEEDSVDNWDLNDYPDKKAECLLLQYQQNPEQDPQNPEQDPQNPEQDQQNPDVSCSFGKMEGLNFANGSNSKMELRVWDERDLLLAKNILNVLAPSAVNCEKYGDQIYFCSEKTTCVNDCSKDCALNMIIDDDIKKCIPP